MGIREVAALATAGLTVLLLTACDPIATQWRDASLGLVDGELQVVSCRLISGDLVLMEARDFTVRGSEWTTFFSLKESVEYFGGQPFGPGVAVVAADPNFTPVLTPGMTVSVLVVTGPKDDAFQPEFVVPESGMPEDGWIRPDGDVWAQPCRT